MSEIPGSIVHVVLLLQRPGDGRPRPLRRRSPPGKTYVYGSLTAPELRGGEGL
ncbi:hypothetical protein [Streptomyces sp. NPDC059957]|uniref:hypothetical protein n=1 Tax=unclassified Streptomyces TaxID=2593676 RepID=UPI003658B9E8